MTKKQTTPADEPLGIVLYTDGGCRPNPGGHCGWGVHGYTYALSSATDKAAKKIDLPTNEGYRNGNGLAKNMLQVTPLNHYDAWAPVFSNDERKTSNNVAELSAAIQGVQLLKESGAKVAKFILDSEYVLKGIGSWSKAWIRNNWIKPDGLPVANQGEWKMLLPEIEALKAQGVTFDWEWTKGHSDNIGNIRADRNATRGLHHSRNNDKHEILEVHDSKEYWKADARPSRFFGHSCWYFFTHLGEIPTSKDGRFVYHCGIHDKQSVKQGTEKRIADIRKNELWGKPSGEVRYSVLFTKNAEPILECIRAHQDAVSKHNYCTAVVCDLATTFKQEHYDTILRYGMYYTETAPVSNDVYTLGDPGEMLTGEANPPRRALFAMDNVQLLERVLESCLATSEPEFAVVLTDLTNQLYDVEVKKTKETLKLKKAIQPGLKTIKVPIRYNTTGVDKTMELTLSLGLHTPDRNVLAAMADNGVKVSVVTWRESDISFRHAFILDTAEDTSIYAAFHTNVVFLKA